MSLTIEQLEQCLSGLGCHDCGSDELQVIVGAEIKRRKHGPLMLAEAIASGKPFRRRAWPPGLYFTMGHCHGLMYKCVTQPYGYGKHYEEQFRQPGWYKSLNIEDLPACDYELAEGGER